MSSAEAAVFDWYANLLPLVDMMCCCCAGTYSLCKFHDQNSVQFIVYKLLIYVQYWLFIYYWFTKSVSIKSWGIDMLLLLIGCSGRKSKPWTDMQIHAQYFKQALGLKQNHIWHHGWQHMLQVCFTTMMKMMMPCLSSSTMSSWLQSTDNASRRSRLIQWSTSWASFFDYKFSVGLKSSSSD